MLSAADGLVLTEATYANEGWVVVVQHSDSLIAVYSGLQQPAVSSGSRVSRGQVLGYAGGSPLLGPSSIRFLVYDVGPGGERRTVAPEF